MKSNFFPSKGNFSYKSGSAIMFCETADTYKREDYPTVLQQRIIIRHYEASKQD